MRGDCWRNILWVTDYPDDLLAIEGERHLESQLVIAYRAIVRGTAEEAGRLDPNCAALIQRPHMLRPPELDEDARLWQVVEQGSRTTSKSTDEVGERFDVKNFSAEASRIRTEAKDHLLEYMGPQLH